MIYDRFGAIWSLNANENVNDLRDKMQNHSPAYTCYRIKQSEFAFDNYLTRKLI